MKKQSLRIFLSFFTLCFILSSCVFLSPSIKGNGNVEEETRNIGNFEKIKVSHGLEVHLIPDEREHVRVFADDNLFDVIITEVDGDVLKIYTENRIRRARAKKVYVHYIEISEIKSSSGAHVKTDDLLVTRFLETEASSGSHQKLEINADQLRSRCSSGAHIKLSGKAEEASLRASSGAHIKAGELSTKECEADVSSGAHIHIEVTDNFDGEASSGGHIYYSGSPRVTNSNASSGGQIIKR